MTAEQLRLEEDREQKAPWKKWGSYLSERQWGTVREDYSEGEMWCRMVRWRVLATGRRSATPPVEVGNHGTQNAQAAPLLTANGCRGLLFSRRSSMRPRTVAILLTALARAAAAARRRRRHVAVTVLAGLVLGGCSPALTRPPVTQPELLTLRTTSD